MYYAFTFPFLIKTSESFRRLQDQFGPGFFNNTILCATRWSYRANQVAMRKVSSQNEQQWQDTQNQKLRSQFSNVKHDLDAVFIDSSAKSPYYETSSDQGALENFNAQVHKLWNLFIKKNEFYFENVDEVR